jgi:hypothetical protein
MMNGQQGNPGKHPSEMDLILRLLESLKNDIEENQVTVETIRRIESQLGDVSKTITSISKELEGLKSRLNADQLFRSFIDHCGDTPKAAEELVELLRKHHQGSEGVTGTPHTPTGAATSQDSDQQSSDKPTTPR